MKLKHIAEKAGVSVSTVARALRNDSGSASEKAQKIRKIADNLGYQPNWKARALSNGKTHTIGLPYIESKWIFEEPINEVAISLMNTLQDSGYGLRLIPVNDSYDWKSLILGGACDGIAFFFDVPEVILESLANKSLPVVVIGKYNAHLPCVLPDDTAGSYRATRHLLSLGHEKIAFFIHEDIREHESVEDRINGYEQAMAEFGKEEHYCVFKRRSVNEVINQILTDGSPTGVICYTQYEGMQLLQAAWANGISVPTDLSIISFNNVKVASLTAPALTTIGYDTQELGRIGAEKLISCINQEDTEVTHQYLKEEIFIRGSTSTISKR